MAMQLTLSGVRLADDATFANFVVGSNQQLIANLQSLAGLDNQENSVENYFYIWGERGSGKSHLLQACCHLAQQSDAAAFYLPLQDVLSLGAEILSDLEELDLICVDDIHLIVDKPDWQEALFYLYNRLQAVNARLLISSIERPAKLNLHLADLVSRLNAGVLLSLQPLADDDKVTVLQTRAHQRGFELTKDVAQFLLRHCSRNLADLFTVLDKLDQASLMAQRRITIPFVKQVLVV